jgi:hypothetical protein
MPTLPLGHAQPQMLTCLARPAVGMPEAQWGGSVVPLQLMSHSQSLSFAGGCPYLGATATEQGISPRANTLNKKWG